MLAPMTVARFRILMLVSLVLLMGAVAADVVASHQAEWRASDHVEWSTAAGLGAVFAFSYLILFIAGFVGMYMLRCWGRNLSFVITVLFPLIGVVFTVVTGPVESSMPSSAVSPRLLELSTVVWGAVLALAYYSPVSKEFITGTSLEPKPFDGSA